MAGSPADRRSRSTPLWQLLLGVLIVGGLAWIFQAQVARMADDPVRPPVNAAPAPVPPPAAIPAPPVAALIPEQDEFSTWPVGAAGSGTECPAGRTFTTGDWQISIRPDGTLGPLSHRDQVLVRQVFIHGRYVVVVATPAVAGAAEAPDDPHDTRFFQGSAGPGSPLQLWEDGNRVLLRKTGSLGNKRHPEAASYREELRLLPGQVTCDVEVTLLVPLASHYHIFLSLAEVPIGTLAGRGFRALGLTGERRLAVVPQTYARDTDIRQDGLRQFCAVTADGWLTFATAGGSTLALSDTRAYGGQDIRLDLNTALPWLPQAVTHPAGSVFRWRWSCTFRPFPESGGVR